MYALKEYVPHDAAGIVLAFGAAFDFRAINYGYPPAYLLRWGNQKSVLNDRWKRYFAEGPKRGYLTLKSTEYQADFFDSAEYHKLYEPSGLKYAVQTMFFNQPGEIMGIYACNRFGSTLREDNFSDTEKIIFDAVAPWVFYAFRKYRWIAEYDFFQLRSFDDTAFGVILADDKGRIGFANNIARELLTAYHRSVPDRITPHLKKAQNLLASVCSGHKAAALAFRNIGTMSPYGTIVPFRIGEAAPESFGTKKGTVFFLDVIRINHDIVATLSPREREVTHYLIHGRIDKEIASALGLSEKTIQTYIRGIFQKLGVTNRTEAAVTAMKLGLS